MKTHLVALAAALTLTAAPLSAASAFDGRWTGFAPYEVEATGALPGLGAHDGPFYEGCPMSSASEGNANQQTRPVKQYGQTSGGYRC